MGSGELGSAFRIVAPKQSITASTPSSQSSSPPTSSLLRQTSVSGISDHFGGEFQRFFYRAAACKNLVRVIEGEREAACSPVERSPALTMHTADMINELSHQV